MTRKLQEEPLPSHFRRGAGGEALTVMATVSAFMCFVCLTSYVLYLLSYISYLPSLHFLALIFGYFKNDVYLAQLL